MIKFENFILEKNSYQEIIVYHSSPYNITKFDFDKIQIKAGSSTRIDGIFFSNKPQQSWGEYLYKIKIITKNPAIFDLKKSQYDSLGVQEVFDALLKGETSYMIDDLIEYGGYDGGDEYYNDELDEDELDEIKNREDAENLVEEWSKNLDLIIITGENYAKHDIEYIVPDPHYNGHSAKIIILEKQLNKY